MPRHPKTPPYTTKYSESKRRAGSVLYEATIPHPVIERHENIKDWIVELDRETRKMVWRPLNEEELEVDNPTEDEV